MNAKITRSEVCERGYRLLPYTVIRAMTNQDFIINTDTGALRKGKLFENEPNDHEKWLVPKHWEPVYDRCGNYVGMLQP